MSEADPTPVVEYRDIPGFPGYRVGDDGSVWSLRRSRGWARLRPTRKGQRRYLGVTLCGGGRRRQAYIHHLVLEAFVGPRPEGLEACHANDVASDARLANLRWDTCSENRRDSIHLGTFPRGERSGTAKITERDVREIRRACAGGATHADVAARFGVTRRHVGKIVSGERWAHVQP